MWISVTLQAEAEKAEALSDALMEAGALSVSIEDADAGTEAERPQFGEPGHLPTALWDHSRVIALFDGTADAGELGAMLAEAARAAGFDAVPPFTTETVAEQDWVQLTQSQFDPIRITDRLWIVPSWHAAPDPAAINIELDPGMAFGTGSHPTTRLVPGVAVRATWQRRLQRARLRLRLRHPRHRRGQARRRRGARHRHRREGGRSPRATTPRATTRRCACSTPPTPERHLRPGRRQHPHQPAVRARPGDLGAGRAGRPGGAVRRARDPGRRRSSRPGRRTIALHVGAAHDGWIRLEGTATRAMMITRCPACQTVFRLRPEQLHARGGEVRCGRGQRPGRRPARAGDCGTGTRPDRRASVR
jgi:predicted Zn finger-like uncharacterized protein